MSEQNPYAPVVTAGMTMPPGAGMVPPQGFAPPPMPGYAPAPAQGYDHPGMTLTELSFAPVPADAPAAPVEPPAAAPSLVSSVLPSGGAGRRLSLGGRTPLVALVLVLLLGAGGVYFGTGLFKSKAAVPAPVVHKPTPVVVVPSAAPSAAAVVAPAKPKPAAKPVVKPLVGKVLAVTPANSRTFGGAYSVLVPTGWKAALKGGRDSNSNTDVTLSSTAAPQIFSIASARPSVTKGPLTPAKFAALKAAILKDNRATALPGDVKATVLGAPAQGFDATATVGGHPAMVRTVVFEHAGTVYAAFWMSPKATFSTSVPTFNQLLASVKFAK